jgi:hypothetical protein
MIKLAQQITMIPKTLLHCGILFKIGMFLNIDLLFWILIDWVALEDWTTAPFIDIPNI